MKPGAVTFDVGGIIYSDNVFKRAIFDALNQLSQGVSQEDFDQVYFEHLKSQSGSLRNKLCIKFLASLDKKAELMQVATKMWRFTSDDLYPDAKECISAFKSQGIKIGLVANQPESSVESLKSDGIFELIDFLGISAVVGIEKPDLAIFELALSKLNVAGKDCVHIGNRIDTDVIPAKKLGIRTVWIRRGEANPAPTPADLAQADITADDLTNLPKLVSAL